MGSCVLCEKKSDEFLLKDYNYWSLYLDPQQPYLGRCQIVLKRHLEDLSQISLQQREELWLLLKKLKKILDSLYSPDLYNYSSLGNITRHLHLHVTPRYAKSRDIGGVTFVDKRFGKNYAPLPTTKIPKETILMIKDHISQKLK